MVQRTRTTLELRAGEPFVRQAVGGAMRMMGEIFVMGRTIEEALMAHEAVEETNVIGVPDEYRGEAPVAYVKLKDGQSTTEADLKHFLTERLNKIEMPKEIIFKDALPKTLIGKLSKKELREEYAQTRAAK